MWPHKGANIFGYWLLEELGALVSRLDVKKEHVKGE